MLLCGNSRAEIESDTSVQSATKPTRVAVREHHPAGIGLYRERTALAGVEIWPEHSNSTGSPTVGSSQPARTRKMTTPPSLPGALPDSYGFGLEVGVVGEQNFVGHGGGTIGFTSNLYHFPDLDLNVAICTDAFPTALTAELVSAASLSIANEILVIAEG